MATQAKRRRVAGPVGGGDADPDPVAGFLSWCGQVGLELSPKVAVSRQGTVAGYGMVARESVQPGELLFAVPRAALLSQHTCSIGGLLERERGALQSQSGWVPLLLALLHELQAPASPWSPYFALWPELGRLEHPMFWPEEERRRLLQGTGVPEAVEKDLANIRSEYYSIVLPFMEAHPDLFSPRVRSLELYRQLVALVMAYSFQEPLEEEEDEKEPNSPLMVPAADILNHLANHNANLEYSPAFVGPGPSFFLPPQNCLRMVATQPIPKGHEIFNTYGQMANWQLIHMYGFVEPYPDNTDDTADIQMVTVREAALQGTKAEAERLLLYERWDFLCKLEMVGEEGAFVIGREEVLTEEELTSTLKECQKTWSYVISPDKCMASTAFPLQAGIYPLPNLQCYIDSLSNLQHITSKKERKKKTPQVSSCYFSFKLLNLEDKEKPKLFTMAFNRPVWIQDSG
ncbi:N-lysine methyltransferase SETD6 isoform X2 [Mirounga leonina]|uniref:N-lysine methyltransferase SETD6 isoform X2 n=1 Tax=Mirounga leonina TaxID=9715 RepID=UPI00156BE17D|nr:N-lysine methyltransferase SETD6 isoform X2 [Mirounga leonina]